MMSGYDQVLPQVFTRCLIVDRVDVPRLAGLLVGPSERYANGSSFAVTVDETPPRVKVWLSRSSFERVLADDLFGSSPRGSQSCD